MNRALAIVTVLSLFIAGIVIGALAMHIYHDRQIGLPIGPPGRGADFLMGHLHRRLDLSRGQEEEIEEILRRSHNEAYELRRDVHPRVMQIMDRAHEEIAAILTPEQREEFHRLLRDNRRRAEHFFLGPPGRGRGRRGMWGGPRHRPWGPPPDGSPAGPPPGRPDDQPSDSAGNGTTSADAPLASDRD